MDWRIYYSDGSTSEGEGDPSSIALACRFDVQVIVIPDEDHGRRLIYFADYYLYRTDLKLWIGVAGEISAMMALTQHTGKISCVLWGAMMDNEGWHNIQQRASFDEGFPPLNGKRRYDQVKK